MRYPFGQWDWRWDTHCNSSMGDGICTRTTGLTMGYAFEMYHMVKAALPWLRTLRPFGTATIIVRLSCPIQACLIQWHCNDVCHYEQALHLREKTSPSVDAEANTSLRLITIVAWPMMMPSKTSSDRYHVMRCTLFTSKPFIALYYLFFIAFYFLFSLLFCLSMCWFKCNIISVRVSVYRHYLVYKSTNAWMSVQMTNEQYQVYNKLNASITLEIVVSLPDKNDKICTNQPKIGIINSLAFRHHCVSVTRCQMVTGWTDICWIINTLSSPVYCMLLYEFIFLYVVCPVIPGSDSKWNGCIQWEHAIPYLLIYSFVRVCFVLCVVLYIICARIAYQILFLKLYCT